MATLKHLAVALVVCLANTTPRVAGASDAPATHDLAINVNPIKVELSRTEPIHAVQISVGGSGPGTRFQASAFAWGTGKDGGIKLTATREVSLYPTLFNVSPTTNMHVRIGVKTDPPDIEKTYRLILDEFPMPDANQGLGLKLKHHLSIPVFYAPVKPVVAGEIRGLRLADGKIFYSMANTGNVHITVTQYHLIGRDGNGAIILDKSEMGWYVLAKATRAQQFKVPRDVCSRLSSLAVEAETDSGPYKAVAPVSGHPCGE